MNKILLIFSLLFAMGGVHGQESATKRSVVFRFVADRDTFYVPWNGNGESLDTLLSAIDRYRTDILAGEMPVYVDGYCSAGNADRTALQLAKVRSNRVKSELIVRGGLKEEHFITRNHTGDYNGLRNVVIVSLILPVETEISSFVEPAEEEPEEAPFQVVTPPEKEPFAAPVQTLPVISLPVIYKGWYAGVNLGLPFFWGDFTSTAADKTYIGFSAGIYGGCQFTSWLGVSLSLDYAYNKTGHRDYAAGFLLDEQGMTWYTSQNGATERYDELYGKVNMFSLGLHADLNANRLFGRRAAAFPLKLIVSPAVYANTFSSNIYTKGDDAKYVNRNHSRSVSLGLGGDVMLRYDFAPALGVHLRGTGLWITDNAFDNIRTAGRVKQNAMWGVGAGVIWRINAE